MFRDSGLYRGFQVVVGVLGLRSMALRAASLERRFEGL